MLRLNDVAVAGVHSPVLLGGAPEGDEAVVFLHGNPGFCEDWEDLSERVGAFARTIAPDMPGFGNADKPAGFDYTVDGYVRHLDGLLQKLGVKRLHFVLHDFGGLWGLTWAAAHPDSIASLTLIDVGIAPDYKWHYLARIWRTPVFGEIFMATTTRAGLKMALKHGNPRGLPDGFVDRMYDHYDMATRRAVLRLYRATNDVGERSERCGEILRPRHIPTLVLWGRADPYFPVGYAERQRAYFPEAEVVVFHDSGHWPFADNPEGVAAAITPFLKAQVLRAAH